MSMQRPWYKMYPDQFFSATMGWPGDLKGFYLLLINLAEARGGKIKDDLTLLSRATGYRPTTCKRLLSRLETLEKITKNEIERQYLVKNSEKSPSQPIEIIESGSVEKNKNKNKISPLYPPLGQKTGAKNGHRYNTEDSIRIAFEAIDREFDEREAELERGSGESSAQNLIVLPGLRKSSS